MANINYSLSQRLGRELEARAMRLAVAESCTGGGLAEEVTAVSGSSVWFDRGFVTYSNEAKMELLEVHQETLQQCGAVSAETAKEMAMGVIKHSHAQIALSITGVAGPTGGTAEHPVGMVWFGLAHKDGRCETRLGYFTSGRKSVRRSAIQFALQWLLQDVTSEIPFF